MPVRQVLPDLAILGIAQRQPANLAELAQCRGVDDRHRRGRIANELVAVVEAGQARRRRRRSATEATTSTASLRPALTLISAWVSQVARSEQIDTALLATRSDLVALLVGDPRTPGCTRVAGRAGRGGNRTSVGRFGRTDVRWARRLAPHRGRRAEPAR